MSRGDHMNKTLYKLERDKRKNIYFAEYSKEFRNREGPGPGSYMYEAFNSSFNQPKCVQCNFNKVRFIP